MDIAKLLAFGVEQGASDCHLSSGEPPMLRINGDLKKLDNPALSQESPRHGLRHLTDALRRPSKRRAKWTFHSTGDIARFRVTFHAEEGQGRVPHDSVEDSHARAARHAAYFEAALRERERAGACYRTHGLRQVDDARRDDRSSQQRFRRPHPDRRGPDRVRALIQEVSGESKRAGLSHPFVRQRPESGVARRPGHYPDRRNERPRNHSTGAHGRRDRPPCFARCTVERDQDVDA